MEDADGRIFTAEAPELMQNGSKVIAAAAPAQLQINAWSKSPSAFTRYQAYARLKD